MARPALTSTIDANRGRLFGHAGFIRAVGRVAQTLGLEPAGYRLLANMGKDAHQEVAHFHMHIFAGRPLGPMLAR